MWWILSVSSDRLRCATEDCGLYATPSSHAALFQLYINGHKCPLTSSLLHNSDGWRLCHWPMMPPSCLPFSRYYPTTRDAPPRPANLSPTLLLASSEGSLRAPVGKPFGFYPRGPCEPCDCWPITSARCPLNTHSGTTHHNGIVHRSSSPSSFWFVVGVHLLPDEPHRPSREAIRLDEAANRSPAHLPSQVNPRWKIRCLSSSRPFRTFRLVGTSGVSALDIPVCVHSYAADTSSSGWLCHLVC